MKIVTVFKTHFDIGFTELSAEVVRRYSTKMLEDVLATCEGTQSLGENLCYKWTMAAWPLVQTLAGATPALRARAEALNARGHLLWHALPFTTHPECCGVEDFVRGMDFARDLCARYNRPFPLSAKMTDVPGHTRFLVPALVKAGVKFLHLGCNPASMPPDVPLLYWWEHSDGSRVLTFYNQTYGSSVLPPQNWPYPVWLNMNQTNDNIGPQGPEVIRDLLAETAGHELVVGSMDDFYRELLPYLGDEVPVVRADLADTWIHGVGSYPAEVGRLRRLRERLYALEKECARAGLWNETVAATFRTAYEAALLFCEHTWGLDVKTHLGSPRHYDKETFLREREEPRAKRMEESWEEQRARVALLADCVARLETWIPAGGPDDGKRGGADFRAAEKVACGEADAAAAKCAGGLSLAADEAGNVAMMQNGERLLTVGSVRYTVAGMEELTNFQRAYLRRFPVWAIYDFGRMEYPECEQQVFEPIAADVERAGDWLRVTHRYDPRAARDYGWPETTVTDYLLCGDRVKVTFCCEKPATPFIESASLRMTPASKGITLNKTGGLYRPETDVADCANHVAFCLERFVDCNEDTLAILAKDAPLVSQGEDLLFAYRRRCDDSLPGTLYFNLCNNMWGTNFPQWTEGTLRAEFEIVPHAAGRRQSLYPAEDAGLALTGAVLESVRVLGPGQTLYRLRETDGKSAQASFAATDDWVETDWFGENERPLTRSGGRVQVELAPCEIKTVRRKQP